MTSTWNESTAVRGASGNGNDGSFATHQHSDPEVDLVDPDAKWGSLPNVHEGSRSPWGTVDYSSELARGIVSVGTAGHGGIKLSPERNRVIPAGLKERAGWYEEDAASSIVGMYFPEAFPNWTQEKFEQSVKDWFPDGWELATGKHLRPGDSRNRDRDVWAESHAGDFVMTSASSRGDMVEITARRGSDDTRATFLVPTDEYRGRSLDDERGRDGRFVIDTARHEQVVKEPEAEKPLVKRFHTTTAPSTPAARDRLAKDLAKRWRESDGTVRSLAVILETEGVSGKSSTVENGKRKYYLKQQVREGSSSYSILPVTKATFDAVNAPDDRTDTQRAYQDAQLVQDAYDRAIGFEERRSLSAKLRVADAAVDTARAREK
jgi:hypothetical protein